QAQIETTDGKLFRSVTQTAIQAGVGRWHERHETPQWTPHDLRRTFATRCGDLKIAPHIVAKLLNHTIPSSETLPVYLRSEWLDERKEAAIAVARDIAKVVK